MPQPFPTRSMVLLETNIDDMNPELFPHVIETAMERGARDVWITPVVMKKGRPAHQLSVLCLPEDEHTMIHTLFAETTTFGVRRTVVERIELLRETVSVQTPAGDIDVKLGRTPDGCVCQVSPEFRSCEETSRRSGRSVQECYALALAAYYSSNSPR